MKLSRRSTILVAGLLAGAATGAVVQSLASAEAAHRVRLALFDDSGFTAGAVSVNPWTGQVALADVSGEARGVRVQIGKATFRAKGGLLPAFIAPAFADDEPVKAENIVIDSDPVTIHIPSIEAAGTELTADDLKAILDPKSDLSATDRVAKLTASSIVAPEVILDLKIADVTENVIYKDLALKDVEKGKIEELTAGSTVLKATSTKNVKMQIDATVGKSEAKAVDLGLYAEVMTTARKDADPELQPLYESFVVNDFKITMDNKFEMTIGAVSGGDVSMRPFLKSLAEIQKEMPTGKDSTPTPQQTKDLIAFFADLYTSISAGKTEVRDITGTSLDPANKGGFKLRRVGMSNFADDAIGEVSLDGLDVDTPDTHVAIGNFAFRGFNFKDPLTSLAKASADGEDLKTVNPRKFIPTLDQITVSGVDINVPAPAHDGNAAGGDRNSFKLGSADFSDGNYLLGAPTKIAFAMEHLALDLPTKDPQVAPLIQMGYSSLDLSAKSNVAWDEATKQIEVKEMSVSGVGMGSVSLKSVIANVPKDLFVGDMPLMQAAALGVMVKEVDLKIENAGLIDKALNFQAQAQKLTPDQLRQQIVQVVTDGIPKLMGKTPSADEVVGAIVSFVEKPVSLEIAAISESGLGVVDAPLFNNPPDLFHKVKIRAVANQ